MVASEFTHTGYLELGEMTLYLLAMADLQLVRDDLELAQDRLSYASASLEVENSPGQRGDYTWYSGRRSSWRAMTRRITSLVPSPMIIRGASR